jgi:hypothetical protein
MSTEPSFEPLLDVDWQMSTGPFFEPLLDGDWQTSTEFFLQPLLEVDWQISTCDMVNADSDVRELPWSAIVLSESDLERFFVGNSTARVVPVKSSNKSGLLSAKPNSAMSHKSSGCFRAER